MQLEFIEYLTYNKCKNGTRFIKFGLKTLGRIQILDFNEPGCFINYFYIKPKYQNIGIGSKVLQDIFQECRDLGLEGISLFVDVNNERAIKLYKRLGFVIGFTTKKKLGIFYCMFKQI